MGEAAGRGRAWLERAARKAGAVLERSRAGRLLIDLARVARAVAHSFRGEKISLRASALTYITVLSLVPLLAVIFAIVRAVGQEGLRKSVHDIVFNNLAPGVREQIGTYLDEFIARASGGAMGSLGGLVLVASAAGLFHNIERSLDEIWGVARPRSLVRRTVIYWCVLTMGPVALAVSVLATGIAEAAVADALPRGVLAAVPWATSALVLFFLYFAVPNAKVNPRAAVGGALVSATAWELAKHGYAYCARHFFRYNAIYGSVGAIPLFLLWVYVGWLVVLFGARLAYALQYAIQSANAPAAHDARSREVLCARVALEAVLAFARGAPAPTASDIAQLLALDVSFVLQATEALKECGLLAEAASGGVVPARAPEQITLLDIARAASGTLFGHTCEPPSKEATTRALSALFEEADRKAGESLGTSLAAVAMPLLARARRANDRSANPVG